MHEPDVTLIRNANSLLSRRGFGGISNDARTELATVRDSYTTACQLANGKDDLRSRYWSQVAKERHGRLLGIVERHGELCVGK